MSCSTDRAARRAIDESAYRASLDQLATQPEYVRLQCMPGYLRDRLLRPYLSVDEMLAIVFKGGARQFWQEVSETPMTFLGFVRLLAATAAQSEQHYEMQLMAVADALLSAHEMDVPCFTGDTSALMTAQYRWHDKRRLAAAGWRSVPTFNWRNFTEGDNADAACREMSREAETQPQVKVKVRPAADWLLSVARFRHLVPESLGTFLRGEAPRQPESLAEPERTVKTKPHAGRGPRPGETNAVARARAALFPALAEERKTAKSDVEAARRLQEKGMQLPGAGNDRAKALAEAWQKAGRPCA